MVTNITSLSRNGLADWLLQRVTAVILGGYALFLMGYFLWHPTISYTQWHDLFASFWMQIFNVIALLSLLAHGWVGLWTITTDYLNSRALGAKSTWVRLPLQLILFATLLGYTIWGIHILWGL